MNQQWLGAMIMIFKTICAIVALIALAACSGAQSGSSLPSSVLPGSGDSPFSSGSPTWQVHSAKTIQPGADNLAAFAFSTKTNTQTLVTANDPSKNPLLGNHDGESISAQINIAGVLGVFTYAGEPSCGNTISNVRLFFTSTGGPFAFTNFWWSDVPPGSAVLSGDASETLTATLDPTTPWSDWNGQPSSGLVAKFDAAASNITSVG